jgi:hypothetical protein
MASDAACHVVQPIGKMRTQPFGQISWEIDQPQANDCAAQAKAGSSILAGLDDNIIRFTDQQ